MSKKRVMIGRTDKDQIIYLGKMLEYAQWTCQNSYKESNEDHIEAIFYFESLLDHSHQ